MREFTRVPLKLPVRLSALGTVVDVPGGLDVSASGASLLTAAQLPVGTPCRVEILLGEQLSIGFGARVVRAFAGGVAVHIEEIDYDSFDHLRNLLRFNSDDPEAVEREFCSHLGLRDR